MIRLKRARRFCYFMVMVILALPCVAQEVKRPPLSVPATADSASQLVPEGWVLDKDRLREDDLNGDGRADAAFMISHGGAESAGAENVPVKHVLVLALRDSDGKLHRSVVSDAAVLDGDEGGVFRDPFDDMSIDKGTVVISHYGGSRDRWNFTHRYRFQNGRWSLIGLSLGHTDTLNLEHYDDQDINLSTGLVKASEKGGYEDEPQKPETSGGYYELEVWPVETAPQIDGRVSDQEWPGYTVRLQERDEVLRNRKSWRGPEDLSARIHSTHKRDELFLAIEVADNQVTSGDAVRLVTRRGLAIRPLASKFSATTKGYVFEARFSLKTIARALKAEDKYIVENLEMALDPASPYGDFQGFPLPVSVEIVDADRGLPKNRVVLSTRLAGSPFTGSIRIFRPATLELISDIK
jgi:hypothetical protein